MKHGYWLVPALLACGSDPPLVPDLVPDDGDAPRGGVYFLRELHYRSLCSRPDTLRMDVPPAVENTLRFKLSPADVGRGIFDALEGRLTVVYRAGAHADSGVIADGPEFGQYTVVRDTLWVAMARTRWLGVVPFTEWRDGTLAGHIVQGCESLALRLSR